MRITRQRDLKINLGNFESMSFGCSVTMGHGDIGYTDAEALALCQDDGGTAVLAGEIAEAVLEVLNCQLIEEINDARELTTEDKSVIIASFTEQRRSRTKRRR